MPALIKSLNDAKKTGGAEFSIALEAFYGSPHRRTLALQVINHLLNNKSEEKNILNLQLRAPESGFIFHTEDLKILQDKDFKICITCHEYKLNHNRRWLQSIMHQYFHIADLVLFFNEKDMSNACKHADRSIFLDDILSKPFNKKSYKHLLHGFSSKSFSTSIYQSDKGTISLFTNQQELTQLKCDILIGNLSSKKETKESKGTKGTIRYKDSEVNFQISHPFKLERLTRENVKISSEQSEQKGSVFDISGVIVNASSDEIQMNSAPSIQSFSFDHDSYNLRIKSKLSRVPPTIEYPPSQQSFTSKPPNIIIFGLIREGKGYEEALQIIETIHTEHKISLPNTRLIITGKPLHPFIQLAKIINKKFDTDKFITPKLLFTVACASKEKVIEDEVTKVLNYKLDIIKTNLIEINSYSQGIECEILKKKMAEIQINQENKLMHEKIEITNNLQYFISKLTHLIPEGLPIDIFLDTPSHYLPQLFSNAKYAIKYDEKGWANNASGLINLLSFKCILYAYWGMCTEKEVTEGKYRGAIILPENKYCLKKGEHLTLNEEMKEGKRKYFKGNSKISEKKDSLQNEMIIQDIIEREKNMAEYFSRDFISTGNNEKTLEAARLLLDEKFNPQVITEQMIKDFDSLYTTSTLGSEVESSCACSLSFCQI